MLVLFSVHLTLDKVKSDGLFSLFQAPGIYSSTEMLDFGTLRTQGKEKRQYFSKSLKKKKISLFSAEWLALL